ncbi:MAG: hypothetical protein ABSD97_00365 [Acidimicrobiales bacterium]|jgi:hypothetical protein
MLTTKLRWTVWERWRIFVATPTTVEAEIDRYMNCGHTSVCACAAVIALEDLLFHEAKLVLERGLGHRDRTATTCGGETT